MIDTSFLEGKTVAVMGLGKSGTATARALTAAGASVWAWDDGAEARQTAAAAGIAVIDLLGADFAGLDLLVWSPGIAHTFPKPHPVAAKARDAGLTLVCDVDLLARAKPSARTFGVTGTNGKSTATTLLGHVLEAGGRAAAAGGNLGNAALAMPDLGPEGRYVLELSSYQLELVPSLALDVAVLLNITPDHLGRHGGMDGYIAAKSLVFSRLRHGGTAVVGVDDAHSAAIAAGLDAGRANVVRISAEQRLDKGVSAQDGVLCDDGHYICDLKEFGRLPGRHNWQNACAVYAAARADGIAPEVIARAFATYPGLAHRQELVAAIDGVLYVNDSKATNADAVDKALCCYQTVYWIAGGQAKEGGIDALAPHFHRIRHAFLIGEATPAFARALAGKVGATPCGTLEVAVSMARDLAALEAIRGAVVLLSPACASWDQFKSFEHRGDEFRRLVAELPGRRAA